MKSPLYMNFDQIGYSQSPAKNRKSENQCYSRIDVILEVLGQWLINKQPRKMPQAGWESWIEFPDIPCDVNSGHHSRPVYGTAPVDLQARDLKNQTRDEFFGARFSNTMAIPITPVCQNCDLGFHFVYRLLYVLKSVFGDARNLWPGGKKYLNIFWDRKSKIWETEVIGNATKENASKLENQGRSGFL